MRSAWVGVRWFGAALFLLGGCSSTEPTLKPPLKEEYNLPPEDDARYSAPIAYPKETLNNPLPRIKGGDLPPGGGFKGPARGSSGAAMRGAF